MSLIKEQYELIKPNYISLNEIKQRLKLHWIESSIIIHIEDIKQILSKCTIHTSNVHTKCSFPNDVFIKNKINPLSLPFKPNMNLHNKVTRYNPKIKQRIIIEETTDERSFPILPSKTAVRSFVIDKQHSINIHPHLQVEQAHNIHYYNNKSERCITPSNNECNTIKTDKHCNVNIKEVIDVMKNLNNPIEQTHLNDNNSLLNNTITMQSLLLSPIPKIQETQSSFSSFTQEIHLNDNTNTNTNNVLQTEIKTHKQQSEYNKHLPQNFSNCVYIKTDLYNGSMHNKYESSFNNNNNNNKQHSIPFQVVSSSSKHHSLFKLNTNTYKPRKYYIKDY